MLLGLFSPPPHKGYSSKLEMRLQKWSRKGNSRKGMEAAHHLFLYLPPADLFFCSFPRPSALPYGFWSSIGQQGTELAPSWRAAGKGRLLQCRLHPDGDFLLALVGAGESSQPLQRALPETETPWQKSRQHAPFIRASTMQSTCIATNCREMQAGPSHQRSQLYLLQCLS